MGSPLPVRNSNPAVTPQMLMRQALYIISKNRSRKLLINSKALMSHYIIFLPLLTKTQPKSSQFISRFSHFLRLSLSKCILVNLLKISPSMHKAIKAEDRIMRIVIYAKRRATLVSATNL